MIPVTVQCCLVKYVFSQKLLAERMGLVKQWVEHSLAETDGNVHSQSCIFQNSVIWALSWGLSSIYPTDEETIGLLNIGVSS